MTLAVAVKVMTGAAAAVLGVLVIAERVAAGPEVAARAASG
jgi:hypothetical protein